MKMPMANAASADTQFGVTPKGKVSGALSNVYDFTMKQKNKDIKTFKAPVKLTLRIENTKRRNSRAFTM